MKAHERLQLARKSKFPALTATEVARRLAVPVPTYLAHENGSRGFSREAKRYARAFSVNLLWLRDGIGPMQGSSDPVLELFNGLSEDAQREAVDYMTFLRNRPR